MYFNYLIPLLFIRLPYPSLKFIYLYIQFSKNIYKQDTFPISSAYLFQFLTPSVISYIF